MSINVKSVINAVNAIGREEGLALYNYLKELDSSDIKLSFEGINRVSSAFLNASIGKMVVDGTYSASIIDRKKTKDIILIKIDNIVSNAHNYVKHNEILNNAVGGVC